MRVVLMTMAALLWISGCSPPETNDEKLAELDGGQSGEAKSSGGWEDQIYPKGEPCGKKSKGYCGSGKVCCMRGIVLKGCVGKYWENTCVPNSWLGEEHMCNTDWDCPPKIYGNKPNRCRQTKTDSWACTKQRCIVDKDCPKDLPKCWTYQHIVGYLESICIKGKG